MLTQNWKTFGTLWEVSDIGEVRNSKTKKLLKLRHRKDGYLDVKLSYRRFLVHRLVALCFLSNPNNYPQVNHLDGVRNNPNLNNLEWVSQKQNMEHAKVLGLFPDKSGERNPNVRITKVTAKSIKLLLATGVPMRQVSKVFSVSYHTVSSIKYGKSWSKK